MKFPELAEGEICRKQIRFEGKVQMVGFRYETKLIADRLGLTGKAVNQKDGSVLVEVQGSREKIECLISALQQVPRIKIQNYVTSDLPAARGESGFGF